MKNCKHNRKNIGKEKINYIGEKEIFECTKCGSKFYKRSIGWKQIK